MANSQQTYYPILPAMLRKFERMARRDAFTGTTPAAFEQWRAQSRETLRGLLGLQWMETCPLLPETLESVRLPGGIRREKLLIQTEPGIFMPFYLLIPPEFTAASRVFLCPPGHGGAGKYSVAGLREIAPVAGAIDFYNYDYGRQLACRGHVAVCPDCRGFGERREAANQGGSDEQWLSSSCFQLSHMAEPLGMTVIGMLVWDLQRLIDYLAERGDWPMERLSCLGFSGGGMQTLWLAALDDRVRFAVISGYLYGYRDALLALCENCSCNYVPGLWQHFDMGDIASLIAPRPLVVQSCREDHLNGPRGFANVREQLAIVQRAYALFGAGKRLYHDVCPGDHHFHSENLAAAFAAVL